MPYEVEDIRETVRFGRRGERLRLITVIWTVKGLGPFTTEMPKEEFSAEKMKAILEKEAAEISGLTGGK